MRMWEIREKDQSRSRGDYRGSYRMGMRDKSVDEAYECGYEDGYEDAMKEMEEHEYGERSSYRSMRHEGDGYGGEDSSYRMKRR